MCCREKDGHSEAVFWVEWPSSVGQARPGRAYHGLTCRALHSSCPPCSVQRRNSLSLSTIRPVLLLPALQRHSLSLYTSGGGAANSRFAVLSISRHTKWWKLLWQAHNWSEKSESRGVSGLEDCRPPRKSGRQNQRCPSRRIVTFDIIVVTTDDDIRHILM